jgi:hypothetical protein
MIEPDDTPLTFSDEDFERRYSPDASAAGSNPSRSAAQATKPVTQLIRSRNRYMRTLLRRRLIAGGPS